MSQKCHFYIINTFYIGIYIFVASVSNLNSPFSFYPHLFSTEINPGDKWIVIVDRASLLLIHAISGLQKIQELCWRLMELHSLKIVSSGIIWVSLQEVNVCCVFLLD